MPRKKPPKGPVEVTPNFEADVRTYTEEKAAEALVILDISQPQLDACPKIEHLFRNIGGTPRVMEYLAGSEEPEARAILTVAAKLTGEQAKAVPFEALCLAAGIPTKKAFGVIAAEVTDQASRAANLVAVAARADVVKATVDNALTPFGDADRKMLHQAAGFVPVPKNSVTHIHGNQINDASTHQTAVVALPPVEQGMRRLGDRFNEAMAEKVKSLPVLEVTDGDEEEDEEDE